MTLAEYFIARFELRHVPAGSLDSSGQVLTGNLVPRPDRAECRSNDVWQPGQPEPVGGIDRGCMYFDQQLVISRNGLVDFFKFEDVGRAVLVSNYRFHRILLVDPHLKR